MMQSIIGGFVDFNTRTSNLTDPRFVAALERKSRITDWHQQSMPVWTSTYLTRDLMQELARDVVFYVQNISMNVFYAFVDTYEPFFAHHIPITDENGRLLIYNSNMRGQVWADVLITSGSNAELAWEFTRHLIYAYANPIERALLCPEVRGPVVWGNNSLATPIMRSLFESHTRRSFEHIFETWVPGMQTFIGLDDPVSRARQFDNAINRIAAYNERPMAMLHPMIPERLIEEHFDQFMAGLIDAQTAAQRMHNAVTLWLIE